MASLNRVWKGQHLTVTTKLRLYQALVLSVLIHPAEMWSPLVADMKALDVFHEMSAT